MRKETKIMKRILMYAFPGSQISVRFKQAANYVDGSDKMIVSVDGVGAADVCIALRPYLRNVSVCRYKEIVARSGECDPYILNPDSNEWISLDVCEFVEIKE